MWNLYWSIYERLEIEFCDLTFFISLEDVHLNVFSIRLAELLLRIGQECENAGKTLATQFGLTPPAGKTIDELNFPSLGNLLCPEIHLDTKIVEVIWINQTLTVKSLTPFNSWSLPYNPNPIWYKAYNGLKHNRNGNFNQANYENVINALAGLFILNMWLRKDDIERDSEWIVLTSKRITAYSKLFNPNSFLQLDVAGSIQKKLKLIK